MQDLHSHAALPVILALIQDDKLDPSDIGLNATLIEETAHFRPIDIDRLIKQAKNYLHLAFDEHAFANSVKGVVEQHILDQTKREFVRQRACYLMMRNLFNMKTDEFRDLRIEEKVTGGQYTPTICSNETKELIQLVWQQCDEIQDLYQKILAVGQQSNQPLNMVWAALKQDISSELNKRNNNNQSTTPN